MGDELDHLDDWLPVGRELGALLGASNVRSVFRLIGRERHTAWVEHTTLTLVELTLDFNDRLVFRKVVRGAMADRLRQRHGHRLDPTLYSRLTNQLVVGQPAEPALQVVLGPQLDQTEPLAITLHLTGEQVRTFRLATGAVLDVTLASDGTLQCFEVTEGSAAAHRLLSEQQPSREEADARQEMPIHAATWGEALLIVRMDGGTPTRAWDDWLNEHPLTEIYGSTPEGPKRWLFHIEDRASLSPVQLGSGTSALFDPADALLFASKIQRIKPPASPLDHALAAAAVRKALSSYPDGEELPPSTAFLTMASKWMFAKQRARFTRDALEILIEALET